MKDIYDIVREFGKRRGQQFALATLVRAQGSSYRRPGARMLVCEDGHTVGSLSGGCLEEEVALRAHDVLQTGASALMEFDTRRRFGCNGKIEIFVERVSEEFLHAVGERLAARENCAVVTVYDEEGCQSGSRVVALETVEGGAPATPQRSRRSSTLHSMRGAFVQEIHPPLQLLIVGEGPDSAPLRRLADFLGWQAIELMDTNELMPLDEWSAAIVKTHNYGRDFAALQKLLPLNLRYVGLIGPRKRRDQLLNELLDVGVAIDAGFFAPAGLDLAAETPEEIAAAVVSEIQRVFAGGTGASLRERKIPIHTAKARPPQASNECEPLAR